MTKRERIQRLESAIGAILNAAFDHPDFRFETYLNGDIIAANADKAFPTLIAVIAADALGDK